MSKIVVTTDLSDQSTRAFAPAADLAAKLGASLVLVTVVEDTPVPPHGAPLAPPQPSPDLPEEMAAARTQLEELRQRTGIEATTEVLSGTSVADAISAYAAKHQALMIAVATHGRSGLQHLFLGSVAADIVRHAKTPVVCYPPTQ